MGQTPIAILLPPPLLADLDAEASRSGRNRSEVLRSAARRGLDAQADERAGKGASCSTCDAVRALVTK